MVNINNLSAGDIIVRSSTGRRYIVSVVETRTYRAVYARIEKNGKPFGKLYPVSAITAIDFTNEWLTT